MILGGGRRAGWSPRVDAPRVCRLDPSAHRVQRSGQSVGQFMVCQWLQDVLTRCNVEFGPHDVSYIVVGVCQVVCSSRCHVLEALEVKLEVVVGVEIYKGRDVLNALDAVRAFAAVGRDWERLLLESTRVELWRLSRLSVFSRLCQGRDRLVRVVRMLGLIRHETRPDRQRVHGGLLILILLLACIVRHHMHHGRSGPFPPPILLNLLHDLLLERLPL